MTALMPYFEGKRACPSRAHYTDDVLREIRKNQIPLGETLQQVPRPPPETRLHGEFPLTQ